MKILVSRQELIPAWLQFWSSVNSLRTHRAHTSWNPRISYSIEWAECLLMSSVDAMSRFGIPGLVNRGSGLFLLVITCRCEWASRPFWIGYSCLSNYTLTLEEIHFPGIEHISVSVQLIHCIQGDTGHCIDMPHSSGLLVAIRLFCYLLKTGVKMQILFKSPSYLPDRKAYWLC
jgi:hypothetical protein